MKKRLSQALALILTVILTLSTPIQSHAASETASSINDLLRIVTTHSLSRDGSFTVAYKGDESDLDDLFESYSYFFSTGLAMYDDPTTSDDADYIAANLNWWTTEESLTKSGSDLIFNLHYFETLPQTEYVNRHVSEILSDLGVSSMSNYEKVRTIHNYVCGLITYTDTGADSESCVYGAIVNHQALCNGYALCMYKLLVECGIPCKYIGGTAGSGRDAGGHAWNIVALGDKWYNLDATWDDTEESTPDYSYFLKGSSDFDEVDPSEVHTMDITYRTGDFAATFPIAKTAFKQGMDDENHLITIGGTSPGSDTESNTGYTFSEIIDGKYPSSGKFTVKKGKRQYLQLFISDGMENEISKVSYKITPGKKLIKSVKKYGVLHDNSDDSYFTEINFVGKEKGKVNIKVTLKLTNGQTFSYTFKGKVK